MLLAVARLGEHAIEPLVLTDTQTDQTGKELLAGGVGNTVIFRLEVNLTCLTDRLCPELVEVSGLGRECADLFWSKTYLYEVAIALAVNIELILAGQKTRLLHGAHGNDNLSMLEADRLVLLRQEHLLSDFVQ